MQGKTSLVTIDADTANLLIGALKRGNAEYPVSWITLATYAELYFSEEADTRNRLRELVDDLLTLDVPVVARNAAKGTSGYFICNSANDLTEALVYADEYTAERLSRIERSDWYQQTKKRLQALN